MKIEFIGTGNITAPENNACCLIDDHILVDCGNGIVKTLAQKGHEVNDVDTLIITHLHGDHFLDVPFLIMQRCFTGASGSLKIYCPDGTEEAVDEVMRIAYDDVDDFDEIKKGAGAEFIEIWDDVECEIDGGSLRFIEVEHGDCDDCYGFIIEIGGKRAGFSGDSAYCSGIGKIVSQSDISILDMSFTQGGSQHMGEDNILHVIDAYHKPVYATHMSTTSRRHAETLNNELLTVTRDGQIIEV